MLIISVSMLLILFINLPLRIRATHQKTEEMASDLFWQMDRLIQQNPDDVQEVFSLIPTKASTELYAIHPETYLIAGSTKPEHLNKNANELGFSFETLSHNVSVFHAKIDGRDYLCAIQKGDSYIFARCCLSSVPRLQLLNDTLLLTAYLLVLSAVILGSIYIYIDKKIIKTIVHINQRLNEIKQTNSGVLADEASAPELNELIHHINSMLESVRSSFKKISIALELSELPIGIYEYTEGSRHVLSTRRVKDILMLSEQQYEAFLRSPESVKETEQELQKKAVRISGNMYRLGDSDEHFIRFVKFTYEKSTIVILMDVTSSAKERLYIERERDTDQLTDLYNRRAFYKKIDELFQPGISLGDGAMIIIDADRLKYINDTLGHINGDTYIKKISSILSSYKSSCSIVARLGGDEFAVWTYGYRSHQHLVQSLQALISQQETNTVTLANNVSIPVSFSVGCAYYPEDGNDFHSLMKTADERMYQNKQSRNQLRTDLLPNLLK